MPLPVAHGILGASVVLIARPAGGGRSTLHLVLLGGALGILPDIDLVLAWLVGWGSWVHGGFTHSILFAFVVGLLVARWRQELRLREALIYGGAMLTHGSLDMLVRKEFGGAALYWPFSNEKLRFGLFDYFSFLPGTDPLDQTVRRALEISLYEFLIFTPLLLLAVWINRDYARRQPWLTRRTRSS